MSHFAIVSILSGASAVCSCLTIYWCRQAEKSSRETQRILESIVRKRS